MLYESQMDANPVSCLSTVTGEHSSYAAAGGRGKKNTLNYGSVSL